MLSVQSGEVSLVPTTFEWAESIDIARAQLSLERAEKVLKNRDSSSADIRLAEARLHRALVRKSVASTK
jgi:F-type H+-transporting ATPase subunit epsilon